MWRKILCLFVLVVNRGRGADDFTSFYIDEDVDQCAVMSRGPDEDGDANATCRDYLRADGTSSTRCDPILFMNQILELFLFSKDTDPSTIPESDLATSYVMYPDGGAMRAERFNSRAAVHMPRLEHFHRGSARLRLTRDHMQTAVNALFILLYGNIDDVYNLPPEYVLKSARTISMLTISKEKLVATWRVVCEGRAPIDVPYRTLELYRPLFKYLNAWDMARLNLSDPRILSYIGTHPDLDRHQVGIVAKAYLRLNPRWAVADSLNLMNNLICGVPIGVMRRVADTTFLMLSDQVVAPIFISAVKIFFHIRACDPIQKQFLLIKMTKSQALGKAHSWSAHDVLSLGLLMAQVSGPDLAVISLDAMLGFTSPVVQEMKPQSLRYFSEQQLLAMSPKPLSIAQRKIKAYFDSIEESRAGRDAGTALALACLVLSVLIHMLESGR